jgi:hypothetical protein
MNHAADIGKRSLLLAGFALAAVLAMVGVAHGEGFGELRRFGGPSTKVGGLTASPVPPNGLKEAVEWQPQHVIGVDPKTNDVFVLEEYEEEEEKKNKTIQFYRLQEFSSEKGGELLGSAEFEFKTAGEVERHAIEGIAIDPKSERLFFLISEERPEGKEENELPDETDTALTALYAFKTTPGTGKKLEPVAEAVELKEAKYESTTPVLVGPSQFKASSEIPGEALLEPHGITVDPATEEVIVTAHIDETPCEDEEGEVSCEPDVLSNPEVHYAIERVKESGTAEQRYVDAGNAIKKESEKYDPAPSSPILAADGGSDRLLTLHPLEPTFGDELPGLAEFPAADTGAPAQTQLIDTGGVEGGLEEVNEEPGGAVGGSLAVDPEEANVLYGVTRVVNEEGAGKETLYGISERSAETLKPIGWSGGQRASKADDDTCDLEPGRDDGEHIQIAVGSHGDVFVLVPEYLREPLGNEEKFPTDDAIIEFGPGGTGCPAASVEKIAATVAGKEVSSAATGQKVTLSSLVKQGDALSTVWKLEDVATKRTVTSEQLEDDQYQAPTLETSFAEAGEYKITEEIIKTDNLDTPSLSMSRTFKVTGAGAEAPKIIKNPENATVNEGASATFEAVATGTPSPTVQWEASSDGGKTYTVIAEATTDTLTIPATTKSESGYLYEAAFKNAGGVTTTKAALLTVSSGSSTGGGGGSNGGASGGGSTSGGSSGTGNGTTTTGGGGVLGVKAVAPAASVASASLVVSSSGAVSIKVSCPAGATTCIGTVTLKTLTAVSASKGKMKAILTVATGSFSVSGGQLKAVTLHLSKTARALLAKEHELRVRAAVSAHDPAGENAATTKVVTLRPAPVKHKH